MHTIFVNAHRCFSRQGYLSRALAGPPNNFDVLALDSSETQTNGAREQEIKSAKRRTKRNKDLVADVATLPPPGPSTVGSLSHLLLKVDPQSLDHAVSEWTGRHKSDPEREHDDWENAVHLVALHACGGLTPNVLRQFTTQNERATHDASLWLPTGVSAVGCCYHLIDPSTGERRHSEAIQVLTSD
jgi:hypothetical protein